MKTTVLLLLFCFERSLQDEAAGDAQIDIFSLVDCSDQKVTPPEGFACETNIVGEGPTKSFSGKITMPVDLDDAVTYRATLKKWEDEKWKDISFYMTGKICEDVHKYVPGVWEKLAKAANIARECPVKAGTYSVSDFKAENADLKLPFSVPGKYLVTALVSKNGAAIMCKQSEITISKP